MGPKAEALYDEIQDQLAALRADNQDLRERVLSLEGTGPVEVSDMLFGGWLSAFPMEILPTDPSQFPRQLPVAWVMTRRMGIYREILPVWSFPTRNTWDWRIEHHRRMPEGQVSGWFNDDIAYVIRDGQLYGKTSRESWHRDGKIVDPWDKDVTHFYEFAGTVDPGDTSTYTDAVPEVPPVGHLENGTVVAWWPMALRNSKVPRVYSVIAWDGVAYLAVRGAMPSFEWYRWMSIDKGEFVLLNARGARVDQLFYFGTPIHEDIWPQD